MKSKFIAKMRREQIEEEPKRSNFVKYTADAIILHKSNIQHGKYMFKDGFIEGEYHVELEFGECEEFGITFGEHTLILANSEIVKLATKCRINCTTTIDRKHNLFCSTEDQVDWPRTGDGRDFMIQVFLRHINYFFDNIAYISSKTNPKHSSLKNIRNIGEEDILFIEFSLNNIKVASQGNTLNRYLLGLQLEELANYWPEPSLIEGLGTSFIGIPSEWQLLNRAYTLINIGYYQEAIIIAFSVLDSKLQGLIEQRMKDEHLVDMKESQQYLGNIRQNRIETLLNFVLRCMDKKALKDNDPELYKKLQRLNKKRNSIMHRAVYASKTEATEALCDVAKLLNYLNKMHKGKFDIPKYLLSEEDARLFF